jgi:hypothetical protein
MGTKAAGQQPETLIVMKALVMPVIPSPSMERMAPLDESTSPANTGSS